MKTYLSFIILVFFNFTYSQEIKPSYSGAIEKYKKFSPEKLFEIGNEFSDRSIPDSALICYSLIYNNRSLGNDTLLVQALNRAAIIYYYFYEDYKTAYEIFLKALKISEDIGYAEYIGRINNNIGNIYVAFKEYKKAKSIFQLTNNYFADGNPKRTLMINLGLMMIKDNQYDSAMFYYRQTYHIKNCTQDKWFDNLLNNSIGNLFLEQKKYDSALYYFNLSLKGEHQSYKHADKAKYFKDVGNLYFRLKNYDSAHYYFNRSLEIAENLGALDVQSANYLLLSNLEEACGNRLLSLEYYKKYAKIYDSAFNAQKYGDINQLQFLYDMAKVDEQIQHLNAEQEIKERTIILQRTIQWILIIAFLFAILIIAFVLMQNKTLNKAYTILVDKNIEVVNIEKINYDLIEEYKQKLYKEDITQCDTEKYKTSFLTDNHKRELVNTILEMMQDKSIYCDPDFSLSKMAEILNSNYTYLSQIINEVFKSNFRSFINEYRVKEARKLLSDPKNQRYTTEFIATKVGFKSKSAFISIFREFTGVTPSFYLKSLKDK